MIDILYNSVSENLQKIIMEMKYIEFQEGNDCIYISDGYYEQESETNKSVFKTVTPEMFGAYGDNIHNDYQALNEMFQYAQKNHLSVTFQSNATYFVGIDKGGILFPIKDDLDIVGNNAIIRFQGQQTINECVIVFANSKIKENASFNCKDLNLLYDADENRKLSRFKFMTLSGSGLVCKLNNVMMETTIAPVRADTIYVTDGKYIFTDCKFILRTYGTLERTDGGFFAQSKQGTAIDMEINNCEIVSYSPDEVFAAYGRGETKVVACNTKFVRVPYLNREYTKIIAAYDSEEGIPSNVRVDLYGCEIISKAEVGNGKEKNAISVWRKNADSIVQLNCYNSVISVPDATCPLLMGASIYDLKNQMSKEDSLEHYSIGLYNCIVFGSGTTALIGRTSPNIICDNTYVYNVSDIFQCTNALIFACFNDCIVEIKDKLLSLDCFPLQG